jgi:hypothetical protein
MQLWLVAYSFAVSRFPARYTQITNIRDDFRLFLQESCACVGQEIPQVAHVCVPNL